MTSFKHSMDGFFPVGMQWYHLQSPGRRPSAVWVRRVCPLLRRLLYDEWRLHVIVRNWKLDGHPRTVRHRVQRQSGILRLLRRVPTRRSRRTARATEEPPLLVRQHRNGEGMADGVLVRGFIGMPRPYPLYGALHLALLEKDAQELPQTWRIGWQERRTW